MAPSRDQWPAKPAAQSTAVCSADGQIFVCFVGFRAFVRCRREEGPGAGR